MNINNRTLLFVVELCVSLVGTSCSSERNHAIPVPSLPQTPISTQITTPVIKPTPEADWQNHWLRHIPCRAPCFEGITPGLTTASDAVNVLNASDVAINVKARSIPGEKNGAVTWSWASPSYSLYYNDALYLTDDEIITQIRPDLGTFKLGDIIKSYGQPTHVSARASFSSPLDREPDYTKGPDYMLAFTWANDGFQVDIAARMAFKPVLTDSLSLNRIVFFDPSHPPTYVQYEDSKPWHGMTSFDDYCVDKWEGRACSDRGLK